MIDEIDNVLSILDDDEQIRQLQQQQPAEAKPQPCIITVHRRDDDTFVVDHYLHQEVYTRQEALILIERLARALQQ